MRRPLLVSLALCSGLAAQSFCIPSDTPTTGECNLIPFGSGAATWTNQIYQTIATASDLRNNPGRITAIGFSPCSTGTHQNTRLRITLSHVPPSHTLATTFAANLPSPMVVFDAANFDWNLTANHWIPIQLQTPFAYDGVSDLVMEVLAEGNAGTAAPAGMHRDTRPRAYANNWTGTPPATGVVSNAALEWCITLETWDNGPLIGTPFASVVADGPGPFIEQRFYSKKAGYQALTQRTSAPTSGPDLRFERIFRDRATGLVPTGFRIDALSLGLDILWIEADGTLLPPTNSMVGIQFAIVPESGALTTTGVIRREDAKVDRAGTDVFEFPFGLTSFPNNPAARTSFLDLDGTEAGLSDGTSASATTQIVALDLPLTAWDLDILPPVPAICARFPRVFFSVPASAVGVVPAAWWGGPPPPTAKGGAWILYTDWDRAAVPPDWTEPRPFARASDLGLDGPGQMEDVDALAVQYDCSGTTKIVFSTQPVAGRNQMLFTTLPVDGDPQPVKVGGGTTATDAAGAGSADVASVCFYDPGIGQECTTVKYWSYVLGWQSGAPTYYPRMLESSAIRGCDSLGAPGYQCMMAGWTTSGRPVPGPGWGVHVWTVSGDPNLPIGPLVFGPALARPLTRTAGGDPLTSFVPLPAPYSVPDPTRCLYFWSTWVAFNTTFTEQAQGRWVRVRI